MLTFENPPLYLSTETLSAFISIVVQSGLYLQGLVRLDFFHCGIDLVPELDLWCHH